MSNKNRNDAIGQRTPSTWMVVAIAQTLMWMFVLPKLCRPIWPRIFGSLHPSYAEGVLNLSSFFLWMIYTLSVLPIYYIQHDFFEQYKIQKNKTWPWLNTKPEVRDAFWRLSLRSIKLTVFNMMLLIPILSVAKYAVLNNSPSFETNEWPTQVTLLKHNVLLTVLHELGFYLAHRTMHAYKPLYKYHKIHHEYSMNTVLASQHNHPIDYILSIATPALLATVIVKPHSFTQFQWTFWVMYANCDDHVGYSFPWSPVRWFPCANLTDMHEYHHAINTGCFASKLDIYDVLFRSDATYWKWSMIQRVGTSTSSAVINNQEHTK